MRKRKLSEDQILKIIDEHFKEGKSIRTIAAKYGISKATVEEWLVQYKANGITAFIRDGRNKTYSTELKLQAIEDYLNGEGSYKVISAKYGLRSTMQLRKWVKVYNSGTTVEERIQIAKDCIANGGNYGETALKFNVSYQQVYQWVKKFKEKGDAGLEDRRGKRLKDQTPRTREEELEIEVAKLKHELYMAQMERDLLKKLDEIERREAYRK